MHPLKNKTQEKAIEEAALLQEQLNRLEKQLIDDPEVKLEDLQAFAKNPSNFTEEELGKMEEIRKELEEKLSHLLSQVQNPKEIAKKRKSLKIRQDWIPMR